MMLRPATSRRTRRGLVRTLCVGVVAAVLLAGCTQSGRLLTKGTMPPAGPDGRMDPSNAPDFIAVAGREEGIAGYVAKSWLFPAEDTVPGRPGDLPPEDPPWPVYADDLQTLVGYMVVGRGFVPLSTDPTAAPTSRTVEEPTPEEPTPSLGTPVPIGPRSNVLLYVRNVSRQTAWFVVRPMVAPPSAVGFDGGAGNACLVVPAGGQLLRLDRAPQEAATRTVQVVVSAGETPPGSLWLDIAADGSVTGGTGVPDWWSDPPGSC